MFIIINIDDFENLVVVKDDSFTENDGKTLYFQSITEAEVYADECLIAYQIVEIEV